MLCQEDQEEEAKATDEKFRTHGKAKEKLPMFSPDVSPITGRLQDNLRDNSPEDQNWIDGATCSYPVMTSEKPHVSSHNKSISQVLCTQMPL